MKIYGRITSSNVMKVLWAAKELGLEYERVDAGLTFGVVDTPEYRAMNPNGRVPTLVDGDLVLWESNAIVRYLAAKHGAGALWPVDPGARAVLDRWMDWQQTVQSPAMTPVFWGLIRTAEADRDQAAIAAGVKASIAANSILNAHLADREWMGGDSISIADIPLGPNLHRFFNLPFERPSLPNLEAYYLRLKTRPSFAEHIGGVLIS
ncbi:MAG: glutathione S-transferase family protein [Alphaproteobacteria bacterium]